MTRHLPLIRRGFVLAVASSLAMFVGSGLLAQRSMPADSLLASFRDPPQASRPRVWWHWMNGNITEDGIAKDLEWMKRIGLGGVQSFDAAQATPQIVANRLVYMSPDWRHAFLSAVEKADALGLELGIASSPGWSETGGPWVKPEQAMKKLVWSETLVTGGRRFSGTLPRPPSITGPYQDLPVAPDMAEQRAPDFYRDTLVLAYRTPENAGTRKPLSVVVNGRLIDAAPLLDRNGTTGIPLPDANGATPGAVTVEFAEPQSISSAVMQVANVSGGALGGTLAPTFEASDDGKSWRKIAQFQPGNLPSTASFASVKARSFRLVMTRRQSNATAGFTTAPGVDLSAAMGLGAVGSGAKALPMLVEFRLSGEPRVNAAEYKAAFANAEDYYALEAGDEDQAGIAPASVLNLTNQMSPDGRLNWTPPPGQWKILRFGYSLTGRTNHPATKEATGLEVDKYDGQAVEAYLSTYLGMYRAITGPALLGKHGLRALVNDSTEAGPSNWTPRILEQFRRLRGYDPLPWLPTLTGELVGTRAKSDAFLYDWRRTLAELTAEQHYGTIARVAHQNGLTVYGEAIEAARTGGTLGDDIDMRAHADIPMAAMWTFPKGRGPAPSYLGDMRGAASAGHLYGRTYVAAELLTSIMMPWWFAPVDLKPMIDAEFAAGINLPVIHTSVHQPIDDKLPGLSLGLFGQFFTRHETWAEMARPWIDYVARTGYMLQQGRNVADVAYFYGEEAPISVQAAAGYPTDVPTHYAYDFVSPQALLNAVSVDRGELKSVGGARYRILYLGGTSRVMTLPVLRKIAMLVNAGATVVGNAPQRTPSLADDPTTFSKLVRQLWRDGTGGQVGKGRVIPGGDVEAALRMIDVAPDFSSIGGNPDSQIAFVHRALPNGDIYFVSNRKDRPERIETRFRVGGKAPEIWHADRGRAEAVTYRFQGEHTVVPLDLAANESLFIVFRRRTSTAAVNVAPPTFANVGTIAGAWNVEFQPGRGAPRGTRLDKLASLSEQADTGIKYFSGVASYTRSFELPNALQAGSPLSIDLGTVGDVAEVLVNGKSAGIAWKAPYRVDIAALVKKGENRLEIRVANLWVNRMIGDRQPGAQKITYTTFPTYTANAPLRPSGLIGPVTLLAPK